MDTLSTRTSSASKFLLQATLVIIPLGLAALTFRGSQLSIGSVAKADPPDFGGSSSPGVGDLTSRVNDGRSGGIEGTDIDTTTYFRAPKDNTRNRWKWTPEHGWQLDILEETYENGWMWVWRDGWQWEQVTKHAAAPVEPPKSEASVAEALCFDAAGAVTTDTSACAPNQREAALKADPADLPPAMQAVIRDSAPYAPGEEAQVRSILDTRFTADVITNQKSAVVRIASDVVGRIGALKDLDSVTDTERAYFIQKIAETQKLLSHANDASTRDAVSTDTKALTALVKEVGAYAASHGISTNVENAPTASRILSDASRIMKGIPDAFSALDDAGYSTMNLRSMLEATQALYAEVSLACSQGRDCARVGDVVQQLEKTVMTMNDMVFASGDSVLKAEVQKRFDDAVSGK